MLPELFIQQLKQSCDMERIVSGYLPLKKKGRYLVGLCPFHSEKSPSFYVYPQNQSFYCFGCGAGGDVITFIRRIENLEYMEAVKLLADRCGLELQRPVGRTFDAEKAGAGNQPRVGTVFPFLPDVRTGQTGV